ncbi:MAG: nuclear transport factor 2 family protein [Candidatus Promineifilaceae bacterium]|nr:nuclear transport factor 2 family protein [Candidatus Promineifilaceae bacterium]
MKDPKLIALLFNECINNRDIDGLAALMTADHVFIDSSDEVQQGKETMIQGWEDFFAQYPDYRNHFSLIKSEGNLVTISGYSTCSFAPLNGSALWSARVEGNRVAEWRVCLDTPQNRKQLDLA